MLQMLGTRLALGGLEAWGNQDWTRNRFRDVMVLLCLYIYFFLSLSLSLFVHVLFMNLSYLSITFGFDLVHLKP
jgi:hypothetical protein